ncbi:MAG: NAD(P)-dependent oxidoreductase [Rhodobacterales bacterium]|nr:NAD(P)-dependent oxidoreductase [Gammaproteobacteria bacterium]MBT4975142.1 NAD(P)-dependent oxidoreductase [Gammaproteobacteria bacterium]MBT5547649.1 NAD(P)-dependent oxidoreductase [Gammaproteobacteria bacterium]MBT6008750.1 NAD(P)-dependent oxidoreductase [Rhodobacterales bacterium]MBT8008781.1 NAD(P)-dependent oxidoreductase [Gammaproteobacteria bacterium]
MSDNNLTNKVMNIKSHRLSKKEIDDNFSDLHAPLSAIEALIEADRCYFCYDAPCTKACPSDIDVPGFIQSIRSDNLTGAAEKILSENIFGGMCARDCPTEELCQLACVRNDHEQKPVEIGLLQRYATDSVLNNGVQLFSRQENTGKSIAVVGAGPAGISCAHRLAVLGHKITVYDAKDKLGGLNEYGIAAYKTPNDFAQQELDYILDIGGITIETGMQLGKQINLESLQEKYDAVFLGCGLGSVNKLNLDNEDISGVIDAVEYIANLRQTNNKDELMVGKNIVVIGGGMTAIDIAVQSKLLGAEQVTIAYRRSKKIMAASEYEQALAKKHDVQIQYNMSPKRLIADDSHVTAMEFDVMKPQKNGSLKTSGENITLKADVVFKAIGQKLVTEGLPENNSLEIEKGRIVVDEHRKTSLSKVWAGGDCVLDGDNLTVSAVQDGKLAAISINETLTQGA